MRVSKGQANGMSPDELRNYIKRGCVMVVMATPFGPEEPEYTLNLNALKRNTEFLVERSAKDKIPMVLTPVGSTGEFYAMTPEEQRDAILTVIDTVDGRLPVVPGVGGSGTRLASDLALFAEESGADGVMALPPFYHPPTEEGLFRHFMAIASRIKIGLIGYNNPDTTKVDFSLLMGQLVEHIPSIVGFKQNSRDMRMVRRCLKDVGDRAVILCGLGEFFYGLEAVSFGIPSYVSTVTNWGPTISLSYLKAGLDRDSGRIERLNESTDPLRRFEGRVYDSYGIVPVVLPVGYMGGREYGFIPVMKGAMDDLDLYGGPPRLPLLPLTDIQKGELHEILGKMTSDGILV